MINIELVGYEGALRLFDPRAVNKAARLAINEAGRAARVAGANQIFKHWSLKRGDINKKLSLSLARGDGLTARLTVASESFSLTYFGAKQFSGARVISRQKGTVNKKRRSSKSGVYVRVTRGGSIQHLPSSFIARMKSGHVGVFVRPNKQSRHIVERALITVPSMFHQDKVMTPVRRAIGSTWSERFAHHLDRLTGPS